MGGTRARLGLAVALALLAACAQAADAPHTPDDSAAPGLDAPEATAASDGADGLAFEGIADSDTLDATGAAAEVTTASDGAPAETAAADGQLADSPTADTAGSVAGPTAGICFAGLPLAATSTGTVPMPSVQLSCPALQEPEWFVDQPVPPPTLQVLIGQRDAAGEWHPLADGDWVPLGTMMQGGFHLDLVPRVTVPGQTDAKILVQLDAFAATGCAVVASVTLAKAWLVQAPGPDFVYTTDPTAKTFVVFVDSATKIKASCGIWLQVVWRVRLHGTAQWGEVVRTLRTYDGSGLAGGVATSP